ncbi:MAG TPA: hypothetical protein VGB42_00740 [Candidatus Thermoplasmatota archaeon]
MSAGQGKVPRAARGADDAALEVVGQQVWFVDQIEPFGVVREPIAPGDRVIGFVVEDAKSAPDQRVLRRVQASRVRKYGDRFFIVPSWFARADQAARQLEKQLARGLAADRSRAYWEGLAQHSGAELLDSVLSSFSPPTYAVVGQLAQAADALAQDLLRASAQFRRVQRALVANQEVMSPAEYAEFLDETRKWARTVRFVLMAVEFYARTVPRAQIDLRNPDAPLPAAPRYIPHEALLDVHTRAGEGRARERPPGPAVEVGDEPTDSEEFGAGEQWHEEGTDGPGDFGEAADEFAPVAPLQEYDEGFAPARQGAPTAELEFEPVAPGEGAAEVPGSAGPGDEFSEVGGAEPFEEAEAPLASESFEPVEAVAAGPPVAEALPEEEEELAFTPVADTGNRKAAWMTPPPPPAPRPSSVRATERAGKLRDKPDLEAIIAASLGRAPPKKAGSKASQGEIDGSLEAPAARGGADALSRELASLLEKSKRK